MPHRRLNYLCVCMCVCFGSDMMEQALLWLIWRGVERRAREKWLVDEATDKANAAFEALMLEEEHEVSSGSVSSSLSRRSFGP